MKAARQESINSGDGDGLGIGADLKKFVVILLLLFFLVFLLVFLVHNVSPGAQSFGVFKRCGLSVSWAKPDQRRYRSTKTTSAQQHRAAILTDGWTIGKIRAASFELAQSRRDPLAKLTNEAPQLCCPDRDKVLTNYLIG
jgi:hypothetical protein